MPASYNGREEAWILVLLELTASPDLVTITTTIDFFPCPFYSTYRPCLKYTATIGPPRRILIISQKMSWITKEERNRCTHIVLNFSILSTGSNTTKERS